MRPGRRSLPGCAGSPGTTFGGARSATGLLQPIGDVDEDDSLEELPTADADALGDLTRAESIGALREAVLTLPVRYREAVVLCDLQEMTYADAAGVARVRRWNGPIPPAPRAGASGRQADGQ